jgi:small conductance mechanosensitive channel
MEKYIELTQVYITEYGLKLIGAIIILVIGLWITKRITNLVNKLLVKRNVDATLVRFFTALVRIALIAFVVIAAISKVGVETTSFIAILGAAGLAIGFALQGSLANLASGVMLIIFRPINVGDYIEGGGLEGIVEEIGIFVTTLISLLIGVYFNNIILGLILMSITNMSVILYKLYRSFSFLKLSGRH